MARVKPTADLELTSVLKAASHEELTALIDLVLARDLRTSKLRRSPGVEALRERPHEFVNEIAMEIQWAGSHKAKAVASGALKTYSDVVHDVAKKVKVKPTAADDESATQLERRILDQLLAKAYEGMNEEEKESFIRELVGDQRAFEDLKAKNNGALPKHIPIALYGVGVGAIKATGFAAYRMAPIIMNAVARTILGRGLAFGANAAATRALAVVAGPIGWTVGGVWLAYDLQTPSYRITIPGVLLVACMRIKQLGQHEQVPPAATEVKAGTPGHDDRYTTVVAHMPIVRVRKMLQERFGEQLASISEDRETLALNLGLLAEQDLEAALGDLSDVELSRIVRRMELAKPGKRTAMISAIVDHVQAT